MGWAVFLGPRAGAEGEGVRQESGVPEGKAGSTDKGKVGEG